MSFPGPTILDAPQCVLCFAHACIGSVAASQVICVGIQPRDLIASAGSTLSDVTEAIGLDAESQTLEGGSIAYLMAVQVLTGLSVVKEYFVPLLLQ